MALPRITVCGAGAAGTAIAGDLALKSYTVNLFELDKFGETVKPLVERGGIELTDDSKTTSGRTGFAKLNSITTDAKEAVEDADIIMITVPAMHHEVFFDAVSPYLKGGVTILFNTGYWASLRLAKKFRDTGAFERVTLCETNIMPYLSKKVGPHTTQIYNSKKSMKIAAFPGRSTDRVFNTLSHVYPQFKKVSNVLETNIAAGGNPSLHVTLILPIIGFVFDRYQGCKFYGEATTQFARLVDAFDRERIGIARKLGCKSIETAPEWTERTYGYKGKNLAEAFRKSEHAERYSPVAALDRVLDEDICFSYVPLAQLGDQLGISTPATKAMVELTGIMLDKNYWDMGVTIKELGLADLKADEIARFVYEGDV